MASKTRDRRELLYHLPKGQLDPKLTVERLSCLRQEKRIESKLEKWKLEIACADLYTTKVYEYQRDRSLQTFNTVRCLRSSVCWALVGCVRCRTHICTLDRKWLVGGGAGRASVERGFVCRWLNPIQLAFEGIRGQRHAATSLPCINRIPIEIDAA
jgi:hypothetical protein